MTTVRRDIMSADARRLAATLNRDLIRPIVDLNLGPRRSYPRIALGIADDTDAAEFVDIVSKLADHGVRIGQQHGAGSVGNRAAGAG